MIVNDLRKEPFLLVRTHYFRQRDIGCDRTAVGSDLRADRQLVTLNLRPHRETGRLGDATLLWCVSSYRKAALVVFHLL
jgi:hypothetical protein